MKANRPIFVTVNIDTLRTTIYGFLGFFFMFTIHFILLCQGMTLLKDILKYNLDIEFQNKSIQ